MEQPAVPEKFVVSNVDADIQQQLDSITQQILSRTRLLHIIDGLNLYAGDRKDLSEDVLVERMRKDIEIELVRGDDRKLSAFNIYYSSRDPKTAQRATNELASLFISENLAQRQERSESTTKFLGEQLEQARQKLAEQEARVRAIQGQTHWRTAQPNPEQPSNPGWPADAVAGARRCAQPGETAEHVSGIAGQPISCPGSQRREIERRGTGGLTAIDRELDRLKAQLADLSSRYTDKHPDVRKTKEQIARTEKMRERVVADMNSPASSEESSAATAAEPKSPMLLDLESQLKANRIEITNHQAEIRDLQAKVGQYQGRLNAAPVMEQQFADISRDYEQSKANYDSLLSKRNQSEMATDLEKTQQGEHFRMLDPPNLPIKPYKPNRLRMCGIGLIVGLVFGVAAAFGREKMSGMIYTEREIKKLLPFEVMSEIPAHRDSRRAGLASAEELGGRSSGGGDRGRHPPRFCNHVSVRLKACTRTFTICKKIRSRSRRIQRSCFPLHGITKRWLRCTMA